MTMSNSRRAASRHNRLAHGLASRFETPNHTMHRVENSYFSIHQRRLRKRPVLWVFPRRLQGAEWVGTRVIHQNTINLLLALETLANPRDTVYADGRTVLISL